MRISEGDTIPGAEDYMLHKTDDDWLVPVYLEYINKAYDNCWVSELFEQVPTDEPHDVLSPIKFGHSAVLSEGLEESVESIIDAISHAAYSQITYEGRKYNWRQEDERRPSDYYAMVDMFCDGSEYDDADFIVLNSATVLVYGEPIGRELIKTDFKAKQFTDSYGDADIVQCHTHRKYEIPDASAYCLFVDVGASDIHRKI